MALALSFIGSTTVPSAATTVSYTTSNGDFAAGDLMIACLTKDGPTYTTTNPTGWTKVSGIIASTGVAVECWYKEAVSADESATTYTWGTDNEAWQLAILKAVDANTVPVQLVQGSATTGFPNTASTTGSATTSIYLAGAGWDSNSIMTSVDTDIDVTHVNLSSAGNGDCGMFVGHINAGSTAVPVISHALDDAEQWATFVVEIKESATGTYSATGSTQAAQATSTGTASKVSAATFTSSGGESAELVPDDMQTLDTTSNATITPDWAWNFSSWEISTAGQADAVGIDGPIKTQLYGGTNAVYRVTWDLTGSSLASILLAGVSHPSETGSGSHDVTFVSPNDANPILYFSSEDNTHVLSNVTLKELNPASQATASGVASLFTGTHTAVGSSQSAQASASSSASFVNATTFTAIGSCQADQASSVGTANKIDAATFTSIGTSQPSQASISSTASFINADTFSAIGSSQSIQATSIGTAWFDNGIHSATGSVQAVPQTEWCSDPTIQDASEWDFTSFNSNGSWSFSTGALQAATSGVVSIDWVGTTNSNFGGIDGNEYTVTFTVANLSLGTGASAKVSNYNETDQRLITSNGVQEFTFTDESSTNAALWFGIASPIGNFSTYDVTNVSIRPANIASQVSADVFSAVGSVQAAQAISTGTAAKVVAGVYNAVGSVQASQATSAGAATNIGGYVHKIGNIEILTDPEFNTDVAEGTSNDDYNFTLASGPRISGGQIWSNLSSHYRSVRSLTLGKKYRFQYQITNGNLSFTSHNYNGTPLNSNIGIYDEIRTAQGGTHQPIYITSNPRVKYMRISEVNESQAAQASSSGAATKITPTIKTDLTRHGVTGSISKVYGSFYKGATIHGAIGSIQAQPASSVGTASLVSANTFSAIGSSQAVQATSFSTANRVVAGVSNAIGTTQAQPASSVGTASLVSADTFNAIGSSQAIQAVSTGIANRVVAGVSFASGNVQAQPASSVGTASFIVGDTFNASGSSQAQQATSTSTAIKEYITHVILGELVQDVSFDDASAWTITQESGVSITGSQLIFDDAVNPVDFPPWALGWPTYPNPTLYVDSGVTYSYDLTVSSVNHLGGLLRVSVGGTVFWDHTDGAGSFTGSITATNNNGLYFFLDGDFPGSAYFDDVSVKRTVSAQQALATGSSSKIVAQTHTASGNTQAQQASTTGTCFRVVAGTHFSIGDVSAEQAIVTGLATWIEATYFATGLAQAQQATSTGAASLTSADTHTASGNTQAQQANVSGVGVPVVADTSFASGNVQAQPATVLGIIESKYGSSGSVTAKAASSTGSAQKLGATAYLATSNSQAQPATVKGVGVPVVAGTHFAFGTSQAKQATVTTMVTIYRMGDYPDHAVVSSLDYSVEIDNLLDYYGDIESLNNMSIYLERTK